MYLDKQWPQNPPKATSLNGDPPPLTNASFFLSRQWLDMYTAQWARENFYGILSSDAAQIERFCYLSIGRLRSRLKIPYSSMGFNEATEILVQNMTVEENDFLTVNGSGIGSSAAEFELVINETLDNLLKIGDWDEIRFSALSDGHGKIATKVAKDKNFIVEVFSERETYWVDFSEIQTKYAGNFIASRSANTRAQLRKALKQTQSELGTCAIEVAATLEQAHEWLNELGRLHLKRWNPNGAVEGFNNPRFVGFHRQCLEDLWPTEQVKIARLVAGQKAIAYMHYFVTDGRAYFNMSGIDYDESKAHRPGLIAHWLAIEFFQRDGLAIYDFLAGTNRYKESLCTHTASQVHLLVRRKRWFFVLESLLRKVKGRLSKKSAKQIFVKNLVT